MERGGAQSGCEPHTEGGDIQSGVKITSRPLPLTLPRSASSKGPEVPWDCGFRHDLGG